MLAAFACSCEIAVYVRGSIQWRVAELGVRKNKRSLTIKDVRSPDNRHLKQDDAFNTTWWPVLSIDKCCQVTSFSIERTDHHVLLKASCCLRSAPVTRYEVLFSDLPVAKPCNNCNYHTSQDLISSDWLPGMQCWTVFCSNCPTLITLLPDNL